MWQLVINVSGYAFLFIVGCGLLLKWEKQYLEAKIELIKQHARTLPDEEAEAYFCSPWVNRILRTYEIREEIPEDKCYSKLILAQRAVNKAFADSK